ncbi:tRNA-specific adenosine deaminase subunit tad3 (tRNA-specific adenosine-34 deaminase subunit tad3) [Durusdinium trenchii]|uniref:tRNA-specific adenosine deaminase subunit tad3 (tRNA-specific adenosine-34 deaminase subunit tad3) n=1 Tax=Durusdinium trenchii TaxID=1381693 RepID=A0ABP0I447_9DINO
MLRVVSLCGALCILASILQGCGDEVPDPACSSYSKGGAGAVTDATTCDTACDKGEGIQTTNYGDHEFYGTSGLDLPAKGFTAALCGELLKLLGPLSEDLKHLKRVRPEGTDLAVLLTETPREDVLQFLQNREITAATVQVPRFCPLTASQMESFSRYWPVKKFVPSFQPLKLTQETRDLKAHFGHLRRLAEDAGGDAGGCAMADASGRLLVACAASNGVLQHPAMVAIATVAEDARKRYAAQGKRSREEEDYLCQDCDVVLTHEPCIMCAMALIHSRVRRIAFCNENTDFGGFGGRIALEQCPNLNHHPRILRWKITIQ